MHVQSMGWAYTCNWSCRSCYQNAERKAILHLTHKNTSTHLLMSFDWVLVVRVMPRLVGYQARSTPLILQEVEAPNPSATSVSKQLCFVILLILTNATSLQRSPALLASSALSLQAFVEDFSEIVFI